MSDPSISFIDLKKQQQRLEDAIPRAIMQVLAHGTSIMGPEVMRFEADLARFCGAKHVLSCSNGTDALGLILMGLGVGRGDAILCPSFTFAATAEAVCWTEATPVFLDVDEHTFNLNAESLEAGFEEAKERGLRPVGVISVDLFGQPADYDAIERVCRTNGVWLLSDAAQSFGATYKNRSVGTIGVATATSFFPAKPLGCYGDGGAVFTDDDQLAATMKSLRVHGQGTDKYDNVRVGMNGRLDTLQAAILIEKLRIFPDEIARRDEVAARYGHALGNTVMTPVVAQGCTSVWAQYTIRIPGGRRDKVAEGLKRRGVPTAIYYPKPLHRQTAYKSFPIAGGALPVSDRIAGEVLSLPMHPYLLEDEQDFIVDAVITELRSAEG